MTKYWIFVLLTVVLGLYWIAGASSSPTRLVRAQEMPDASSTATLFPTPSLTPRFITAPTRSPNVNGTPPPTWTAPPPDPAVNVPDHYQMRRPIAQGNTNWVDRTYPYGSTAGGTLPVHHGVEFVNPRFTPIFAVADGTVIFAGADDEMLIGPQLNFYGNVVIIQHIFRSPENERIFSLYGHMQDIAVRRGQMVRQGDEIGRVGDSGVALGPHLHFEVRAGDAFSYEATRNPELWIFPFQSFGTLAGRVTDAAGNILEDVTLRVQSTDISRFAFSYAADSVNSDPTIRENFTLGDLPANYYEVLVSDENGRVHFRRFVYVYPNQTTWVEVQLDS
ncbi:MAG: hypothetical protein D6737_10830 [Chloroflexi bacterium]|nr:MAG: hypothetical protein CUN54_06420 [Phototrophicales bacterium]RMF79625.1 MAG: hypothetical protein D6737_10830 [Chloroflexota bacterium]